LLQPSVSVNPINVFYAREFQEYVMKSGRFAVIVLLLVCCVSVVLQTGQRTTAATQEAAGSSASPAVTQAPSADAVAQAAPVHNVPRIFFTDVESGPVTGGPNNMGVPISIFGKGFGAERRNSRVTIGGVEVASYVVWGVSNAHNKALDLIVVQPGPKVEAGPIVVSVNGDSSNSDFSFIANNGHVLYVATNGADSSGCSQSSPCATILHTIQAMKPGDTALVRGGKYAEGEIWVRASSSGTAKQAKVVKNYPGEEAYFTNPARDMLVDADYITISGLNFQNGKGLQMTGWASRDQRGNRYINNTFSGTVNWAATETAGHDHVLAGNVCDIAGATTGTMGHCYYITQGSNLKILYNVANGAPGYGIHIYEERRESSDFKRVIKDVLVEGNVLTGSRQRSGMIISVSDAGGYGNHVENIVVRNNIFAHNNHAGLLVSGAVQDLKVYNNTFFQNGRLGIYIENDAKIKNVDIRNNLIYQTTNSVCAVDCSFFAQVHTIVGTAPQNLTLSNNSYHPGAAHNSGVADKAPVSGAIRFADEAKLDLHLSPGAPVVRKGAALSSVPTDFDGRPRPQSAPSDIGAYQFIPQ
jgi:hypothetical protein